MPKFEWICRDCEVTWERDCEVGKAPKRTRCPECNKLCDKHWQAGNVGISFKDDGNCNVGTGANDFHTVRRRYQKVAERGWDKDSADRFLNRSIKQSKEAMADERGRYKEVNLNWEALARDGYAKKLNDKDTAKKVDTAKKLTETAYENANKRGEVDAKGNKLDISKPTKNKQ